MNLNYPNPSKLRKHSLKINLVKLFSITVSHPKLQLMAVSASMTLNKGMLDYLPWRWNAMNLPHQKKLIKNKLLSLLTVSVWSVLSHQNKKSMNPVAVWKVSLTMREKGASKWLTGQPLSCRSFRTLGLRSHLVCVLRQLVECLVKRN
jgi:hypothetical protein